MHSMTRGPLPARVYWTRRLLVLGTLFAMVFGVAHLFAGGDAKPTPQARQAAAHTKPRASQPTTATTSDTHTQSDTTEKPGKKPKKVKHTPPPLPEPEGTCSDEDIAVTPAVHHPEAGGQVTFIMKLRTIETPACTWKVSPDSLTVKITSGADDIWFSRECTRAIPHDSVVVRNTQNTKVPVVWSGRRSDSECSHITDWAMPGWYHVAAAAYAGEPSDLQFHLDRPTAQVVTKTVRPKHDKHRGKKSRKSQKVD